MSFLCYPASSWIDNYIGISAIVLDKVDVESPLEILVNFEES